MPIADVLNKIGGYLTGKGSKKEDNRYSRNRDEHARRRRLGIDTPGAGGIEPSSGDILGFFEQLKDRARQLQKSKQGGAGGFLSDYKSVLKEDRDAQIDLLNQQLGYADAAAVAGYQASAAAIDKTIDYAAKNKDFDIATLRQEFGRDRDRLYDNFDRGNFNLSTSYADQKRDLLQSQSARSANTQQAIAKLGDSSLGLVADQQQQFRQRQRQELYDNLLGDRNLLDDSLNNQLSDLVYNRNKDILDQERDFTHLENEYDLKKQKLYFDSEEGRRQGRYNKLIEEAGLYGEDGQRIFDKSIDEGLTLAQARAASQGLRQGGAQNTYQLALDRYGRPNTFTPDDPTTAPTNLAQAGATPLVGGDKRDYVYGVRR